MNTSMRPLVLPAVGRVEEPFPHFAWPAALPSVWADEALGVLSGPDVQWQLHTESFFEQFESDLLGRSAVPMSLSSPTATEWLRERMSDLYGVPFSDRATISAHRLLPGQGIGIHNDDLGSRQHESHRLVVHLGSYQRGWGGELVLYPRRDPSEVGRVYVPGHNLGVSFAISAGSWHAVPDVVEGVRYTVVWSFFALPSA